MTATRTRVTRHVIALALAAVSAPLSAAGQEVPRPATVVDCDLPLLLGAPPDTLSQAWRSLYPSVRRAALMPLLNDGQWTALLDSTRSGLERTVLTLLPRASTTDPRLMRLRAQLDAVRERVQRLGPTLRSVRELKPSSDELRLVGRGVLRPESNDDGRVFLFRGTADSITLSDADGTALRRAICYHATFASDVLDRMTVNLRVFATEVLREKERRWSAYFDRGYSQLPWELFLNSRRARSAARLDPPTSQAIVLHPSLGVQLTGVSWKDIGRGDAILVEPLGWIWYRNDYRNYFGVSAVVAFTSQQGTGAGPFLHFGRVAKVGYVFPVRRDLPAGARRTGGVLLSVDLYKYLSDRQSMVRQAMQAITSKIPSTP